MKSVRQLVRASGFHQGRLLIDRRRTFWTMTAWNSEQAMRGFRSTGAHMRAMPRLVSWCDEASVVHWESEAAELPDWRTAAGRLRTGGRLSRVDLPSAAHVSREFADPPLLAMVERTIHPKG